MTVEDSQTRSARPVPSESGMTKGTGGYRVDRKCFTLTETGPRMRLQELEKHRDAMAEQGLAPTAQKQRRSPEALARRTSSALRKP